MRGVVVMKKGYKIDNYWIILILSMVILFLLMFFIFTKIEKHKKLSASIASTSALNAFVAPISQREKTIYIAVSKDTANLYLKNGMDISIYKDNISKFKKFISSIGYKTKNLPISSVDRLKEGDILFLVDVKAISKEDREKLIEFVKNGGSLFFNFTAGYSDNMGNYTGESFVKSITKLELSSKGFVEFKEGLSLSPKLLSPFSRYLLDGRLLETALYDKLPIYKSDHKHRADLLMSTFDQISPPLPKDRELKFDNNEAGVLWHGYLNRGKWVYSSLPSYSFYDIEKSKEDYKKLLSSIIGYLKDKVVVAPYPYIDQKSVVFVSEDTEYKFNNFARFAKLAKDYEIPVTAFIVANLANLPEHKSMMSEIAKNRYVEFASHSTTHKKIVGKSEEYIINEIEGSKKIIDKFAPSPIKGFRPPREELNNLMKKHLSKGGYTYILGASDSYLYPVFDKKFPNIIYMPRHGTDDYSYLVNLDWDQKTIVDNIIKEANYVKMLNGIYTLSVHTHLFSYSSNIKIIEEFFKYLKDHPEFTSLNGKEIIKRVIEFRGLDYSYEIKKKRVYITLFNSSNMDIKNLHLALFKNKDTKFINGGIDIKSSVNLIEEGDNSSVVIIDRLPANSKATLFLELNI